MSAPTPEHRIAIDSAFGIPAESWQTPQELRRLEVMALLDAVAEAS